MSLDVQLKTHREKERGCGEKDVSGHDGRPPRAVVPSVVLMGAMVSISMFPNTHLDLPQIKQPVSPFLEFIRGGSASEPQEIRSYCLCVCRECQFRNSSPTRERLPWDPSVFCNCPKWQPFCFVTH